jgi:hypothetical protein
MLATVAWIAMGCAAVGASERPGDALRDAIHAQHTDCLRRVEFDAHAHGRDAMAEFWCDRDEERECKAHGLEPRCGEWQAVP